MLAGQANLLNDKDLDMQCPHPNCTHHCSGTAIVDGVAVGVKSSLANHFAPDAHTRPKYVLEGAVPSQMYCIAGATGMSTYSKLLYRLVLKPPLPDAPVPKAPAGMPPLSKSEFSNLMAWLKLGRGALPPVASRMKALATVFEHLQSTGAAEEGTSIRCPVGWAHFLYPVCMPSVLWTCHKPKEQAALLRALLQKNALAPSPSNSVRKEAELLSPFVLDFLDGNGYFEFPEVRGIGG
jgi:hypothetical protein